MSHSQLWSLLERAVNQFEDNDSCHVVATVLYMKRVKMVSQYKKTYNRKNIGSYQLREGMQASGRLRVT